jgi:hypothetical protein
VVLRDDVIDGNIAIFDFAIVERLAETVLIQFSDSITCGCGGGGVAWFRCPAEVEALTDHVQQTST